MSGTNVNGQNGAGRNSDLQVNQPNQNGNCFSQTFNNNVNSIQYYKRALDSHGYASQGRHFGFQQQALSPLSSIQAGGGCWVSHHPNVRIMGSTATTTKVPDDNHYPVHTVQELLNNSGLQPVNFQQQSSINGHAVFPPEAQYYPQQAALPPQDQQQSADYMGMDLQAQMQGGLPYQVEKVSTPQQPQFQSNGQSQHQPQHFGRMGMLPQPQIQEVWPIQYHQPQYPDAEYGIQNNRSQFDRSASQGLPLRPNYRNQNARIKVENPTPQGFPTTPPQTAARQMYGSPSLAFASTPVQPPSQQVLGGFPMQRGNGESAFDMQQNSLLSILAPEHVESQDLVLAGLISEDDNMHPSQELDFLSDNTEARELNELRNRHNATFGTLSGNYSARSRADFSTDSATDLGNGADADAGIKENASVQSGTVVGADTTPVAGTMVKAHPIVGVGGGVHTDANIGSEIDCPEGSTHSATSPDYGGSLADEESIFWATGV